MSKNYDKEELKKFSSYQNSWWDTNGDAAPLHKINPIRMLFIKNHIDLKDKKVLDVGCGGGILSEALHQSGANVTAIDMCKEAIECAKNHAKEHNIKIDYQKITAEDLVKKDLEKYDMVSCLEMLEHVPNPLKTIESCKDLVKKDGLIFVSTINRNIKAYLSTIVGAEYILKMLPKGTHDYSKFIKPSELISMACQHNLEFISYAGISYKLFTDDFYLSEDVSSNYIACFKKTI